MKATTLMQDYNPCYGFGDARQKAHIKANKDGTFTIVNPIDYDKPITRERAEKSSLPIYRYEYNY